MADIKAIAEELVNLTVKEVNELATVLKDEYGIEPAAALVLLLVVRLLMLRRRHLSMLYSLRLAVLNCRL